MNLPIDPVALIFGFCSIFLTFLYLHEHSERKKSQLQGERYLEAMQQKGYQTLQDSIHKSQEIIGQAEMEGVHVGAEYDKKLAELVNQAQESINASQTHLMQFIKDLEAKSSQFEQSYQNSLEGRINQMFAGLEERLSNFLVTTEQKTTSSIELELNASRNLIENYKAQQLKIIDENILAIMEQTLNIVLAKKLSLKDQLDLVYEGLEKAKAEKFIV